MQCVQSTRRRFIALLSGVAATTSPLAARAQRPATDAASIAAKPDNPANELDPNPAAGASSRRPHGRARARCCNLAPVDFCEERRARGLRYLAAVGEQTILSSGF